MKVAKKSYDKKIGNQRNGEQYKSSSLCLLQHIEFLYLFSIWISQHFSFILIKILYTKFGSLLFYMVS